MTTQAKPTVSGRRIILANRMLHGPTVLGIFSCHPAAIAALVRLSQPDFKWAGSDDQPEDLEVEKQMRANLAIAYRGQP